MNGLGRVSITRPRATAASGAVEGQYRRIRLVSSGYVGHPPRDNDTPTKRRPSNEAGETEEAVFCS